MFADDCCNFHKPLTEDEGTPFVIFSRGTVHLVLYFMSLGCLVPYICLTIFDDYGYLTFLRLLIDGVVLFLVALNFHYFRFTDEGDGMSVRQGPLTCLDRSSCCCACLPEPSFKYNEVTEVRRETVGCCQYLATCCDKSKEHGNFLLQFPRSCCCTTEIVAVHTPEKYSQNCCVRHDGWTRFDFRNAEDAIELVTFLEGKLGTKHVTVV